MERPFRRGIKLNVPVHGEVLGVVRYEHLPFICLFCRHIGHTLKNREAAPSELSEEEKENLGYGIWMRVNLDSSVMADMCSVLVDMD